MKAILSSGRRAGIAMAVAGGATLRYVWQVSVCADIEMHGVCYFVLTK